jgi:hypothetical protein
MSNQHQQLTQPDILILEVARMRGMFGFIKFSDEGEKRETVVEHVFADGRLLVHYLGNKRFRAVLVREEFEPSRDAYWSEGSWVEPEWDGDSARCLNYWAGETGVNIMTDEQAWKLFE